MRTVSYRLVDLIRATINLGFAGENEHTQVVFDGKRVFDDYPNAVPSLTVKPPVGDTYPAVTTRDGNLITWVVTNSDLIYEGHGEIQLAFEENGVVVKSYIAKTSISRSIIPMGEVPTPIQNWIDEANEAIGTISGAVEDAEEARDAAIEAKNDAETAQGKAEDAQAAAEGALAAFPAGGTAGQVLTKRTSADHDTYWATPSGGGGGGKDLTYITPEDFGAAGDGTTDDTTALQDCIDYARTNSKCIKGFNEYKTTSMLTITGNYQNIDIASISYTGEGYALSISGSYSSIRINLLYCANGKGLLMKRTSSTNCRGIRITMNRLYAKGHAVVFETNNYYILYNTFDIRYIKSDTGDCYHCDEFVGENVFMNSSCSCENGWAIYKANGKYYNFTLEADVLNGIYINGGTSYFSGFRIREMVDKLVSRINGTHPDERGGTFIKYVGNNGISGYISRFISEDFVPYEAIDVSEMSTIEDIVDSGEYLIDKLDKLAFYQIIDAPIRIGNWETENGYTVPGKMMIVVGGKKICIPAHETVYTITDADYDMRDAQITLNDAKIFATKMVIGVDDCVIHLPASYCAYGYSEFIVDQSQGHLCTIYDIRDDDNPIFDGETLGAGVYKLKAYCDISTNAITEYTQVSTYNYNDGDNYVWEITRIDTAGGSTERNYVTPEDYGAAGDGVTDDSQAVQDACDAGYAVYFASNKTYYIASTVTIDHDCHLYGGENTIIKTATPSNGIANEAFNINGTLKKTTTLTSDYTQNGETANVGDKFVLTDMSGINIGDIMEIVAEDQQYSYCRDYYYLGGVLPVSDVTETAIFTCEVLPFDIENTEDVSVKVYSAPQIVMENLNFVSDHDSAGEYVYAVRLNHTKNSMIRNCTITDADNGIYIGQSVNTLIDCVTVANMPLSGTGRALDHYGIAIYSSTNTTVQRVMGNAANSCIDMSGTFPNINTRIMKCNLFALSRHDGMGMHENAYNTIFEDCVFGGLNCFGTVYVNRCKFVRSFRDAAQRMGINFRGSHNPKHGKLVVTNCIFDDTVAIQIPTPYTQDNPQAFDHIIDEIIIENCTGGLFQFTPSTTAYVLSNKINRLKIRNWRNCLEIYHTATGIIDEMIVENCEFNHKLWINDHSNHLATDGIRCLRWRNDCDQTDKMYVDIKQFGGRFYMQSGIPVNCSSSNSSDRYQICGKNIASNEPTDYGVGTVNGWVGDSISFTINSSFSNSLSVDAQGNLVFTQPNNTTNVSIFPLCMAYVPKYKRIKMSCVLKNTGATTGATFRPYLAIVDCATGKVTYRNNHGTVQASAQGEEATHDRLVENDSLALFFLYCSTPIAGSETTISDFVAQVVSDDFANMVFEPYNGSSRTGDGTLESVNGMNNILVNAAGAFDVKFKVDLLDI